MLALYLSRLMLGVNDISVYTLQSTQSRETDISASVNQRSIARNGHSGSAGRVAWWWMIVSGANTHTGHTTIWSDRTTRSDWCGLSTVFLKLFYMLCTYIQNIFPVFKWWDKLFACYENKIIGDWCCNYDLNTTKAAFLHYTAKTNQEMSLLIKNTRES